MGLGIRRHRLAGTKLPNVAIMQYNLRALRQDGESAFCYPGYEASGSLRLNSHDLCKLVDESSLNASIDAIPRILQSKTLDPKNNLSDLEHQFMCNVLTNYRNYGPKYLQAYLTESWWLTALSQQFNRFRASSPEIKLYLIWDDGKTKFCEKNKRGVPFAYEDCYGIKKFKLDENLFSKLWLKREYDELLEKYIGEEYIESTKKKKMKEKSEKYGEITISNGNHVESQEKYFYNDQFGLWKKLTFKH
jgi:CRISPR-associated endonuclease/helicase Cas3